MMDPGKIPTEFELNDVSFDLKSARKSRTSRKSKKSKKCRPRTKKEVTEALEFDRDICRLEEREEGRAYIGLLREQRGNCEMYTYCTKTCRVCKKITRGRYQALEKKILPQWTWIHSVIIYHLEHDHYKILLKFTEQRVEVNRQLEEKNCQFVLFFQSFLKF